ncbi:MAG: hypothetical protein ACRD0V_05905 [Acidimicrobiales bacterium]
MSETRRRVTLTRDEVARVLHRASEIEAATDGQLSGDRYDAEAVEQAAAEVGLSPAAVRQAVAELRIGALPGYGAVPVKRVDRSRVAASRFVTQQRLVERRPDAVHAAVDRFLRSQMLELRRRSGDRSLFRPRRDLVASLRRGLDFAGAIKLDGIRTVSLLVTPADERTLVRLEAELASSRANVVAGAAGTGAGVALLMGVGGALAAEPGLVIAAVPAGAAVGAGGLRVAGGRWRQRRDNVDEVLAALLDRL